MILDELREKLKSFEADIATIKACWQNTKSAQQFSELDAIVSSPDFWQHPDKEKIIVRHRHLRQLVDEYNKIMTPYDESCELIEMFKDNEAELEQLKPDIYALVRAIPKFKINLLLNKEEDGQNCYLTINAGAGGTESQDWANMLLRMYLRFCEREDFGVSVMDYQAGEEAGIKSATLYIKKRNAFGFLKAESGIHRLVRISPFDANKRRHTSFTAVTVTAEVEDADIEIDEKDLRIDTYRAGGAGGQHVNKTDSAVRITHIPTNIVVQCQNERSQLQNKQTAMKMLKAKLAQKQKEESKAKDEAIERKKIEWGSQIRSYVLHPYKMVKDHRTDLESPRPDDVLDGDLMLFIEQYLLMSSQQN
ncbi:peptide chain release factor 2 [Candidatus Dependentiae bacterium]|jgi:peptide chain release factor 2|nr:peptide chain release factor 2 [Candidatus Dependentiae bacterium]